MAVPSTDDVRKWVNVPATSVSDAQLSQVITSERLNQAASCTVPLAEADYPEDLAQSLYRRVARQLAGRQIPLGIVGDGSEYGPATLATFDAEVERLEGPRRMVVFG
jgi:hypothetical protein